MELDMLKMESVRIDRLLKNGDFKVFIDRVRDMYDSCNSQILSITNNALKEDDLTKLNQLIAERNVFGTLLYIKEELEDEIGIDEISPDAGR